MLKIRAATLDDVAGIARVHVDVWRSAYRGIVPDDILAGLSYERRERQWDVTLRGTHHQEFVYLAEDENGQCVGFASGGPALFDDPVYQGELFTIYILAAYQRQGLGYRLFFQIVERLSEQGLTSMFLWVLADNPACSFYESLGGRPVKTGVYEVGGTKLQQVGYGWPDITQLK
ncbi:putative N-acetyltransferase YuaI [Dictyobacter alpinus]|uniref:Putative N-acetyltransferase YuaI n=1 Tax=Dictyobacter alpinus TaxID=2014873 RepID=A0A402BCJ4_9CHLR|nr:GNAT family N-acetyltransferase [Dictyobacter alpinus]GCE29007.1 putative N-acetyltransferase YuaI [Dictyobacter alpinus]